jgi:Tfp pilus assembly protein PilX
MRYASGDLSQCSQCSQCIEAGHAHARTVASGGDPQQTACVGVPAASPREPHMCFLPARRVRRREAGLALPAVIAVGAAVAALTGTWFDAALTESRRTRALSDRLIAFHAADAALAACTVRLLRGSAPYLNESESHAEPEAWRRMPPLAAAEAFAPFAEWPMAAQPPRCLVEAWRRPADQAASRAYLVTARGVGAHASSAVWLQHQVAIRDGHIVELRWRRVATVLR